MVNNPGHRVSVYEIAAALGVACGTAFTLSNIVEGFQRIGIFHYTLLFFEFDFCGSYVTDHPNKNDISPVSDLATDATLGTSRSANPSNEISPKTVDQFPKVQPKKTKHEEVTS